MSRMQIKTTYQKPEVEVVYIRTGSQLLDASFPGEHKSGPAEESSEGAKGAFFRSGSENVPASWED